MADDVLGLPVLALALLSLTAAGVVGLMLWNRLFDAWVSGAWAYGCFSLRSRFYKCENCQLRFELGGGRYNDKSSGYGARTLCICTACGTMHAVEHTHRGRMGFGRSQSADRLLAQPAPWFPASPGYWHNLGDTDPKKLRRQRCHHCGSINTLSTHWSRHAPCPKCGRRLRSIAPGRKYPGPDWG